MAMQEFLASYAVQVDEDGARRLQAILDQNRAAGQELVAVFDATRSSLAALKKELSDASGLRNSISGLMGSRVSAASAFRIPFGAVSGLRGMGSSSLAGLSPAGAGVSALGGSSILSVGADFSSAEEAFASFRARMESERPRLSVNTSGITSAVSSAVASIRAMLSSVRVTVPVTAVPQLDSAAAAGLTSGLSGAYSSAVSGMGKSGVSSSSGSSSGRFSLPAYGSGGRVASPTLAMIAEEGSAEYVIPTNDDSRAVQLMRSLFSELSDSAKASLSTALPASSVITDTRSFLLPTGASGSSSIQNVQAPVNIHVSSSAAAPEAVARSIYDTAQRSLLKTLKGVFA